MTYNGKVLVGNPTLSMVDEYIREKGLFCNAKDAYDYWNNKNWLTHKGSIPKTLESAISSYNSIAVNKAARIKAKELGITKIKKKSKRKSGIKKIRKLISENKGLDNLVKLESLSKKEVNKDEKYESYDKQLKDKRWFAFRNFIFAVRGKTCECCGCSTNLQVHHPKYKCGRKAWEYTCNEVIVLCRKCHCKVHGIKDEI